MAQFFLTKNQVLSEIGVNIKKLTADGHSSGNAASYIHESSTNFVGIWVSRSNGWALIEISNSSSARNLMED